MLTTTQLSGFDWITSALAATATATATSTATGPGSGIAVTAVGTNSGTASADNVTLTVPAGGIPASTTIIIGAGGSQSVTITSGSDTKGNTYQVGDQQNRSGPGTDLVGGLVYSQNSAALVAGDVITVHFSTTVDNRGIVVAYASGLTAGSLIDVNADSLGNDNAPSSGATSVTTVAGELAVGFTTFEESVTITEASGYTQIAGISVGATIELHVAYKVLSATGAQTYAPSLSGSTHWVCGVETLKT